MNNYRNLIVNEGTRFGKLVVLRLTDKRNKSGNRIYELKCDCGNICEKTSSMLKKKKEPVRHCGLNCSLMDRKKKKKKHGHSNTHEYYLWKGCQNRAKKNNIPFNLEYSDVIIPKKCPILEIPIFKGNERHVANSPFNLEYSDVIIPKKCPILEIPIFKGNERHVANSPSLDRLVPELGYVKGNVRVISYKANTMKSDASIEEIKIFAKNIITYFDEAKLKVLQENGKNAPANTDM